MTAQSRSKAYADNKKKAAKATALVESTEEARLLTALKALAHPTRFRMAREIAASGELSCGRLGESFPISQPTISHHLKILVDAGVLQVRLEGQHHFVSIDPGAIEGIVAPLLSRLGAEPGAARGGAHKGERGAAKKR